MINKKGFTLIELLIAICIVGILATVAVSNLQSAREKAGENGEYEYVCVNEENGEEVHDMYCDEE